MTAMTSLLSPAYQTFLNEAPKHAQAWAQCVQGLSGASALDKKTESLAYLAVLAALRLESGIPFHVVMARNAGATRAEVVSAVLVGLPAVGNACTTALPVALRAFDQTEGPDAR